MCSFRGEQVVELVRRRLVGMSMMFFRAVTPHGLVGKFQRFGQTYCFHISMLFFPKFWYLPAIPYDVTTQNYNDDIFAAARTSVLPTRCNVETSSVK